jgi:hydroxymethylpyrimidine/phosphomethylpyrimidine kinase
VTARTPVALTIAGSDSGAGAGIQADLKTFASLGVYGTSAITALTAQNTRGVIAVHYAPASIVAAQIDAVREDFAVVAIKIGMLGAAEIAEAVADRLGDFPSPQPSPASARGGALSASTRAVRGRPFVIYDPVMAASSGDRLSKEGFLASIKSALLSHVDCLTPNLAEAAALLGEAEARNEEAMASQGRALLALGPRAILMKGGHLDSAEAVDLLITNEGARRYAGPRIASSHTHGTGCTLSAAIAGYVVLGTSLEDAIAEAKALVARSIEAGRDIVLGGGIGPLIQMPMGSG